MTPSNSKIARNVLIFVLFVVILSATTAIIQSLMIVSTTNQDHDKMKNYLQEQQIEEIELTIIGGGNTKISASLFYNSTHNDFLTDQSGAHPIIVFIPGANTQKYTHLDMHIQLVHQGYIVLATEQRGHGRSEGYFTFYREEPKDISAWIDYLENNYSGLNTTHIGLIGQSLGAGTALFTQIQDDRIYASSLYHPLSNVTAFFAYYGITNVEKLLGFTPALLECSFNMDSAKNPSKIWESRSVINNITPENIKNLLIQHGTEDSVISVNDSINLFNKLNSDGYRTDIQLLLRPGLNHVPNEKNKTSFLHTLAWLNHFFLNQSISLSKIEIEAQYFMIQDIIIPVVSDGQLEIKITISAVFLTLLFLIYGLGNKKWQVRKMEIALDTVQHNWQNFKQKRKAKQNPIDPSHMPLKKAILEPKEKESLRNRALLGIAIFILCAILSKYFNPSLLYGGIFWPVILVTLTFGFWNLISLIRDYQSNASHSADSFKQTKPMISLHNGLKIIVIFGISILLNYFLTYYVAINTYKRIYLFPLPILIRYLCISFSLFAAPQLLLSNLPKRASWAIIPIITLGAGLFLLINQITTPLLIFIYIFIGIIWFVLFWMVEIVCRILLFQNRMATAFLIGMLITFNVLLTIFWVI